MTDEPSGESWEPWFPDRDDPDAGRFKWGWSAADGEVVWRVGGPGDGRPVHVEELSAAWGRAPSPSGGDVLGTAHYVPSSGSEVAVVVIHAYYDEPVPEPVVDWFREAFPHTDVRLADTG